MAKRKYPPKRRDRKTGASPYAKYGKQPYKYSWQSDNAAKKKERTR